MVRQQFHLRFGKYVMYIQCRSSYILFTVVDTANHRYPDNHLRSALTVRMPERTETGYVVVVLEDSAFADEFRLCSLSA